MPNCLVFAVGIEIESAVVGFMMIKGTEHYVQSRSRPSTPRGYNLLSYGVVYEQHVKYTLMLT